MKRIILLFAIVSFLINNHLYAKAIELTSPNKEIKLSVLLADRIYYSVSYQNEELLKECQMRLLLKDRILGEQPQLINQKQTQVNETLTPIVPLKFSTVSNNYNQLRLTFKGNYTVEFRAFDDGIAYRFITDKKEDAYVMGEDFVVHFPGNYWAHLQQPNDFKTAYEEVYTHKQTNEWKPTDKISVLPVLIDTRKSYKILISESDLSDYPCMFLQGTEKNGMRSIFPKVPLEFGEDGDRSVKIVKEADYIAKTSGKRDYPWRYFVITENDKKLVENTMTYKLAAKSQITDPSWIKPGQASWEWWNGATPYGPDVNFVAGCNLETYKYFIDFASQFGIPYIIMDEGWAQSTRDPYTPNPTVDVHEIIRYGKEKNVGIVLWLTWLTIYSKHSENGV